MIKVSISNNMNKVTIIVNCVLKYYDKARRFLWNVVTCL